MAMADRLNMFEVKENVPPPRETRIRGLVWKPLVTGAGWYTRHTCGRIVHQFLAAQRPAFVRCPGCSSWLEVP